jgi:multidrug resistance protein, MATE family
MTTTLHHAPSSIPSDYGLIARYAAHTANTSTDPEREINENSSSEEGEPTEDIESSPNTVRPRAVRRRRRSSVSSNYVPSPSTTMANTPPQPPKGISVTETTPLIPRIHEDEESTIPGDEEEEHLIWKEAKVLARYTLPIFG